MSVVLRGIDKPSDCDYCPFQSDSYCSLLLSYIIVEHGVDPRCLISEISGYTLKNGHRVVISVDDEGRERHEIHLDRKTEPQKDEYGHTIQGTGDCDHCSRLFVDCDGR